MEQVDTQALNKKLAGWAGFKYVEGILKLYEGVFATYYYVKDGEKYAPDDLDFTQSLDACFKWLVPLSGIDDIRFILFASSWGRVSCVIEAGPKKYQSWAGDPRDKITPELLAMAFCLAFEQLKDREGNK